ncbi:MAG: thioredoxin [Leptospira sp.]|nr:thioredoxin [Leptospira sp.]
MNKETNDQSFKKDVIESDLPVLVDFWAPWCGPCRMLGPMIEKVGNQVQNSAKVYKLNVDQNPATAREYGISAIPTVIVFKGGKIHKKLIGVQSERNYIEALK